MIQGEITPARDNIIGTPVLGRMACAEDIAKDVERIGHALPRHRNGCWTPW